MIIYLQLFLVFLEIGAVSFGGGYGMIALMREKTLAYGWLTEESFLNLVAVAESTPGPIAVNVATFVGASTSGILGALCASLGVILPSFIIILIVASIVSNLLKIAGVKATIDGMKPAVTAVIFSTAITMLIKAITAVSKIGDTVQISYAKIIIFVALAVVFFGYKILFKKDLNPIFLIIISAGLGMAICPFLP